MLAHTDVGQFIHMAFESLRLEFFGKERRRRRTKNIWRTDVEIEEEEEEEEEGEVWRTEEEEEENLAISEAWDASKIVLQT